MCSLPVVVVQELLAYPILVFLLLPYETCFQCFALYVSEYITTLMTFWVVGVELGTIMFVEILFIVFDSRFC
jgi:hypothetical protein